MVTEEKKVRIFLGVALSDDARDYAALVTEKARRLLQGVRWVRAENLHITLKFLGWCNPSIIEDVIAAMEKAARFLPAGLTIEGFGAFPSLERAKVIWVGAEDNEGRLGRVQSFLETEMEKMGFDRESRKYHPHITIGRAQKPVRVPSNSISIEIRPVEMIVKELVLFSSDLKKTGAEYSAIERVGHV